jgi:hypothetical protein
MKQSRFTRVICGWASTLAAILLVVMIANLSRAGDVYILRGKVLKAPESPVPVPGSTVYFIAENFRSEPAITRSDGVFELNVFDLGTQPSRPFLEVQFGREPVFRSPIPSNILDKLRSGSVREADLPPIYLDNPALNRQAGWF